MRQILALAVGVVHILFAWLLISGVRSRPQVQPDMHVYASLWIPLQEPEAPPSAMKARLSSNAVFSSRRAPQVPPVVEFFAESGSISSELLVPEPTAATATTAPPAAGNFDWSMEAVVAASRTVRQPDDEQRKDFSPLPTTMSKPCVPRKSSMEWNGKEDRRVTFSGPLPMIKLGKRCVVTIGFVGCSMGAAPEANGHLLDDMRNADRARSSVPDPDTCD